MIELSNLIDYFLGNTEENQVFAVVAGQRKREVGLVVPTKHYAFTKNLFFFFYEYDKYDIHNKKMKNIKKKNYIQRNLNDKHSASH